jgi:competence protein ComEA
MFVMPAGYRYVPLFALGLLLLTTALNALQGPARKQNSGTQDQSEAADKLVFAGVCGACHTVSMVSDMRSESEWVETVEYMVSLGAKGSDEQMEAVMRFLRRTLTKVNVNTATAEQLPLVLDISEAAALAVVKYRGEHGNFKTLDDLKKVPGIDAAKLEARKARLVF